MPNNIQELLYLRSRTSFNGLGSQKPIVSKDQIQHEEPIEFNNAFRSIGFQGRGNLKAFVNPIWKFTVHAGIVRNSNGPVQYDSCGN
ncbi:hypothetical protein HZH68_015293 [Vespula germanica]|uniref:Uncharacterized protein n=1 Tax=Vespula germanica TaxID=30212 RepID=A0A834J5V4_VESGE|nr:hypothetical protein HZH68_015293 [Vespula germanica]